MHVLFIGPTRIGDAVLSSGVIEWLRRRWPGARLTVAAGPAAAPYYAELPGLENLLVLAKRPWAGHWRALWLATAGRLWTAIADTRRSAVSRLLPARRRFIMGAERPGLHKVRQASAMVGAHDEPLAPVLWLGPRQRAAARDLLPPGGPILALAPTANWGGKQWPIDRFRALAERLAAPASALAGARIAIFAGPGERDAALPLIEAIPAARRIDLAGRLDLLVSAACIERASLFVGNDSGLMHIAAAAGVPTLGLFGPSRDEHYAPWGPRAAAVRTALSYDAILARPGYDYRKHDTHMDTLSVDSAAAAAAALLARCGSTPRTP